MTFKPKKILLLFAIALIVVQTGSLIASGTRLVPIYLVSGDYGDYDDDGFEDDFRIWIEHDFTEFPTKNVRIKLQMIVTLPSGFEYFFIIEIWAYADGSVKTLEVTCINGATEPGWYEVRLSGRVMGIGQLGIVDSYIIFDPPTNPKGSALPFAYAGFL